MTWKGTQESHVPSPHFADGSERLKHLVQGQVATEWQSRSLTSAHLGIAYLMC